MNRYFASVLFFCLLVAGPLIFDPPLLAAGQEALGDARTQIKAGQPHQALLTLQAFLLQNPPQPYRHQAHFVMGKTLAALGRHQEALPYLQEAVKANSAAQDYLLFYLYQSYEAQEHWALAQKTLEELLNLYPASLLALQARLGLAKLYQAARLDGEAQKLLEMASQDSLEARFLLGEFLQHQNPSAALKIFRSLYLQYPASPWAPKAQSAAQGLGSPIILRESESFSRAQTLMDGGHYALALQQWSRFLTQFPQSNRRWQARLQSGIAKFKSRDYAAALKTLQEVVQRGPLSLRAEGLFWLGWAALRSSQETLFRQAFTQLFEKHSSSPSASRALYIWGRSLEDEGDKDKAQEAYQQLLTARPAPQLEEEGLWRKGWVLFKQGHYQEAAQSWRELLRNYPQRPSAFQAQYWLGRIYEREDNPLLARMTYEELMQKDAGGYYGWRAQERLAAKIIKTSSASGILGFISFPTNISPWEHRPAGEPANPSTLDAQFLARQEELAALDLEPAAVSELNLFAQGLPAASPLWKEVLGRFYQRNAPDKALYWGKKLLRQGQGGFLFQHPQYLYPQVYWSPILTSAKKTGLDPYLVLAVVREESAFSPQIISPAGAHGLMQLLQDTAQKVARKENIPYNSREIYEPKLNLTLGSRYLADMLQEMGSVPLALAAYNAGPHKVRAWRVNWNRKPEEYLEDIPYDETRNYVKRVLNSYRIYRALYGNGSEGGGVGNLTVTP